MTGFPSVWIGFVPILLLLLPMVLVLMYLRNNLTGYWGRRRMRGKSDDWMPWVGGLVIATWVIPLIGGIIFPTVPPSPCVDSVMLECEEWSPVCNINETVEVKTGPFYDEKTEEVVIYKKEVCIEWENGTRVLP